MIDNVQQIQDLDSQSVRTLEQVMDLLREDIEERHRIQYTNEALIDSMKEYKELLERRALERDEEKQRLMTDIDQAHQDRLEAQKVLNEDKEKQKQTFQVTIGVLQQ